MAGRFDGEVIGRRDPGRAEQLLGSELVHRQRRREHAGPRVGRIEPLQYSLDSAVFAAGTVQGDPHAIKFLVRECGQVALGRIPAARVDTSRLERFEHGGAGFERHLPLTGGTAVHHRDATEIASVIDSESSLVHEAASPTMRTSRTSSTP